MRLRTAIAGRRPWFALAAVVVVTVGAVQVAEAAFPDTDVQTYTGCLTRTGGIGKLAAGSAPAQACGSRETLVHLGGGDITNVIAGEGLTGGGDNGAATLSLDSGHSLPQGCTDGQVAEADGGAWTCAADDAGGAQVFAAQGRGAIFYSDPPNSPPTWVDLEADLDLPAGTYSLVLMGYGGGPVSCRVSREANDALVGGRAMEPAGEAILGYAVTTFEAPVHLETLCAGEIGTFTSDLGVQAIRLGP